MHKGVARLIINASGLTILTKALNSWKEFAVRRKMIKRSAKRIYSYLRKSDLMNAFHTWKHTLNKEKQEENELLKKDLTKR